MDVRAMSLFFALLTVVANVVVVGAVALWVAGRFSGRARARSGALRDWIGPAALPFAWAVALVATSGSLYYSEVAGYEPCTLCWYQRIAMYPMALLLGIATARRDLSIRRYLIPLALTGAAISIYHYQLERFPTQTTFACTETVPCTFTYVWQFHYISIPFMALSGFALIVTLLASARATATPRDRDAASAVRRELQGAGR